MVAVLEHVTGELDGLSSSMPRKGRKAVRRVLERVESLAESIDAEWARGLSRCGVEELESLAVLQAAD